MGGLEQVANLVRAVRLGWLALGLIVAVGGSWTAMQPGAGRGSGPARSAEISQESVQAHTLPLISIVVAANPVCVTLGVVDRSIRGWKTDLNPDMQFRGCPTPVLHPTIYGKEDERFS
jgi:hypothetical protein